MDPIAPSEVASLLRETSRHEPGGVVAFDGDGTLWSGDVGEDFFHELVARGLGSVGREALAAEARAEGVEPTGTATEIVHRIHAAYLAGTFPEERICEIMTWAAAGWRRSELDAFSAEVVTRGGVPARLHAEALFVVERARSIGIEVFIVSASPTAIVEQAARLVGVAADHVIAAREVRDANDVVGCAVERPIPYGHGKVTRLRERIGASRTIYAAFGDNAFDVPLLRASRIPVAIRPKARLAERAAEVPGLRVLEPIAPAAAPAAVESA